MPALTAPAGNGKMAPTAPWRPIMIMPTLYETVRTWLDAQRALNRQEAEEFATHQAIVDRLVARLARYRSLADLASGYYREGKWWLAIVQEFSIESDEVQADVIHGAAYFQRLLQLRRPGGK